MTHMIVLVLTTLLGAAGIWRLNAWAETAPDPGPRPKPPLED